MTVHFGGSVVVVCLASFGSIPTRLAIDIASYSDLYRLFYVFINNLQHPLVH